MSVLFRPALPALACLALAACAPHVKTAAGLASDYEAVVGRNWKGPYLSPSDMRFYPERALREEQVAVVGLSCLMRADRTLTECEVGYVSNPGYQFEEAALRVAESVVIRPEQARIVAANSHAAALAAGETPPAKGTGWVVQPIFMVVDQNGARRMQAIWEAEGRAATTRFARGDPAN